MGCCQGARVSVRLYGPAVSTASVALLTCALLVLALWGTAGRALYRPLPGPVGVGVLAWRMMPPLMLGAILCYFAFRIARRPDSSGSQQSIELWPPRALAWIVAVSAFAYATSAALLYLHALRPEWFVHWRGVFPTHGWAIPLWLLRGIWSAAMEELLYRAYAPLVLERMRVPLYGCVLVPSVFFGLEHVYMGWPFAIKCFLLGCVSGYAVLRTRNIWPALVPHLFFNLTAAIARVLA